MNVSTTCKGITANMTRCRRLCQRNDYCYAHENQRVNVVISDVNKTEAKKTQVEVQKPIVQVQQTPKQTIRVLTPLTEVGGGDIQLQLHQITQQCEEKQSQITHLKVNQASLKSLYNKSLTTIRCLNDEIVELKGKLQIAEDLAECRAFSIDEHNNERELMRFVEYVNQYDAEEVCERLGMSYDEFWAKFNPLRIRRNRICHPVVGAYTDDELLKVLG